MTLYLGQFLTQCMSSIWVQSSISRASAALLTERVLNENFQFVKDRRVKDPGDDPLPIQPNCDRSLKSLSCGHSLIRHRYNRILFISMKAGR
jgi:hypothetical protein